MWGTRVGIVHLEEGSDHASFEYDRRFTGSGIEISPIKMPLADVVYSFPDLSDTSFCGVPGLLADSLPDRFGNAVISKWLAGRGLANSDFNVIDRLCYTASRGMGALEYIPATGPAQGVEDEVNIDEMVRFASDVLNKRKKVRLKMDEDITARQLLLLGTSAGGARAKAVIAWNEESGDIRSGQINPGKGYGFWIIKFDGVDNNGDHDLDDGPQYTLIEYAYHLMAVAAGIKMSECRLLHENGRDHFMTKRFDRTDDGDKVHMQTLGAITHIDYNYPRLCSYEQAAIYARMMHLPESDVEELYRRMIFNVLASNHDDHVKNISFLMDRAGKWRLAPAYDITFAYDSVNKWISAHQMTVNGKGSGITDEDLAICGKKMDISSVKCKRIREEVRRAVDEWPGFAEKAGVCENNMEMIRKNILRA